MAQPTLRTQRMTLEPLADEHLALEIELDDPIPGAEQGEVEYEITRATWQRNETALASVRPHRETQ